MTSTTTDFSRDWAKHNRSTDTSVQEYSKKKRLELGATVMRKKRIYLDLRYWILMRDTREGISSNEAAPRIYFALKSAVENGNAICPIGFPVLLETMRQRDPVSRLNTAAVIDELSGGVTIQPADYLDQLEFNHFLLSKTLGSGELWSREEMAWSYIGFIMGERYPTSTAFGRETESTIQKCMFDALSRVPFRELAKSFSNMPRSLLEGDSGLETRLTEECTRHRHEYKSFKQAFMNEIAGTLDLFEGHLVRAARLTLARLFGQQPDSIPEVAVRGHLKEFQNLIYHGFDRNRIRTEFPGLHIGASLHAARRFRQDNFNKGDLRDFAHARIALPYCNYFLTEKGLGNLITQRPLQLDKAYGCIVTWKEEDAFRVLKDALNA